MPFKIFAKHQLTANVGEGRFRGYLRQGFSHVEKCLLVGAGVQLYGDSNYN